MLSGLATGPSINTAGSPGMSFTRKKLTSMMPNSWGTTSIRRLAAYLTNCIGIALPQLAGENAPTFGIRKNFYARANKRETEDSQAKRNSWKDRRPPLACDDVLIPHGNHAPPLRCRSFDTRANKA